MFRGRGRPRWASCGQKAAARILLSLAFKAADQFELFCNGSGTYAGLAKRLPKTDALKAQSICIGAFTASLKPQRRNDASIGLNGCSSSSLVMRQSPRRNREGVGVARDAEQFVHVAVVLGNLFR